MLSRFSVRALRTYTRLAILSLLVYYTTKKKPKSRTLLNKRFEPCEFHIPYTICKRATASRGVVPVFQYLEEGYLFEASMSLRTSALALKIIQ